MTTPMIIAHSIGPRRMPAMRAFGSQMRMPIVKCARLKIMKTATAGGNISGPKANKVSGSPMLAVLVNIIDGTKACGL